MLPPQSHPSRPPKHQLPPPALQQQPLLVSYLPQPPPPPARRCHQETCCRQPHSADAPDTRPHFCSPLLLRTDSTPHSQGLRDFDFSTETECGKNQQPSPARHRKLLGVVLLASAAVQLTSLSAAPNPAEGLASPAPVPGFSPGVRQARPANPCPPPSSLNFLYFLVKKKLFDQFRHVSVSRGWQFFYAPRRPVNTLEDYRLGGHWAKNTTIS